MKKYLSYQLGVMLCQEWRGECSHTATTILRVVGHQNVSIEDMKKGFLHDMEGEEMYEGEFVEHFWNMFDHVLIQAKAS